MITEVSSPSRVYTLAKKIYGNKVIIELSDNKNKKYKIWDPNNKKWIHFGDSRYSDYTKHNDPERRTNFRLRNAKWADSKMYSPAYMSFWLLW